MTSKIEIEIVATDKKLQEELQETIKKKLQEMKQKWVGMIIF